MPRFFGQPTPDWWHPTVAAYGTLGTALESRPPIGAPMTATGNVGASTPASPAGPTVPDFPDYSHVQDLINQINATNQAAQQASNVARIPGAADLEAQSSQDIAALLNPPTTFGEIDVPSAARAVQSGTVGSPFAGVTGLNLSENERIRRQQIGQQMLSAAYARNPGAPIADPQALVTLLQQQGFAGGQSALQRALQLQLAQIQQQTALAVAALSHSGSYGTGGGRYAPHLPTDYARPTVTTPPTFRSNIPAIPGATGPGTGEAFGIPESAIPDNWQDLTFDQQANYAAAIGANPYYGVPEEANPYMSEYDPEFADFYNYNY